MPRNGSGAYSLPQAAFVPQTTISSAAVNSDLSDIASALTTSIASDGQTPITGPLRLSSGIAGAPAITFVADETTGLYLPATGQLGFAAGGVQTMVFDGSSIGTTDNILLYPSGAVVMPVGTVLDWAGSSAPTGWLLCYGQVIAQATYPGLFAVCGTTYNTGGEGAGNFRLPDCRGRASVGKDNMGGSAANRITTGGSGIDGTTLGANGGGQNSTIAQANLPNITLNTTIPAGQGAHDHAVSHNAVQSVAGPAGAAGGPIALPPANITVLGNTLPAMSGTTPLGGSGTALNVTQPTIIFNKIIFAGR